GNYVGTDATGTSSLGNQQIGLLIENAPGNQIGGTMSGAGNLISGNGGAPGGGVGLAIYDQGSHDNAVLGNLVRTNKDGLGSVPNGSFGIIIGNATNNIIGGTVPGARNIVSGGARDGIALGGGTTAGNQVLGNWIGLDVNGAADGNADDGIVVDSATTTTISGNVVSASVLGSGISIRDGSTGNVVTGNYIGTDPTGLAARGNAHNGIAINSGATGNTIGGTAAGAGNTIAFNSGAGVQVGSSNTDATSTGNAIRANIIHDNAGLGIDLGGSGAP